jgi:hypothetical protein
MYPSHAVNFPPTFAEAVAFAPVIALCSLLLSHAEYILLGETENVAETFIWFDIVLPFLNFLKNLQVLLKDCSNLNKIIVK